MLYVKNYLRRLPILLFFLSSINLFSQDFEFLRIRSAYYPNQPTENSNIDGQFGFFEWGAQIAVPQIFNESRNTILIHKIGYGNLSVFSETNAPNGTVDAERYFHTIQYNLGLIQKLDTHWRLVLNFIPTIASDLNKKLTDDDFLYQAMALFVKSKNEKLRYGFGIGYNTRFGRQLILPMGLLRYNTIDFELDLIFPNRLSAMLKTKNEKFYYGLRGELNGGVFNNSNEIETVNNFINNMGYSRLIVGPAITLKLKNQLNINLHGGYAVGRRLEFIDINDEIFDRTPEPSPFIGIGLSLSPKNKNAEASLYN